MSAHTYDCGTISIANGGTTSGVLAANPHYQNAKGLVIWGSAALTGTVTVQVSYDGTTYAALQSSGADVTITAADATPITFQGWTHLRLVSGSAEGAQRDFIVRAVENVRDCI